MLNMNREKIIRFFGGKLRLLYLIIPPLALSTVFTSLIPGNPLFSLPPLHTWIILSRTFLQQPVDHTSRTVNSSKDELDRSRIAVCLVGGARRFELTGPSIVDRILVEYPNSDLFLHSPLDENAYKLSLLKRAPRLAAIKIFDPKPLPETELHLRVLTPLGSTKGIQGLLQYFNLIEGCLGLMEAYQKKNNFTYDWIVRTRVDGYWNTPLHPDNFAPGKYVVPSGSAYGGLNDRLGIGDLNTSTIALSRLSLLPKLDSVGNRHMNSEAAFKAQLITHGVPFLAKRIPFCIVTDYKYEFPPMYVPVAALLSRGPLSGAKCRPCTPACEGQCVADAMSPLHRERFWTDWENGSLVLCDARDEWEKGWEKIFDEAAGEKLALERKQVRNLMFKQCVADFNIMKRRTEIWEAPSSEEVCTLGLRT